MEINAEDQVRALTSAFVQRNLSFRQFQDLFWAEAFPLLDDADKAGNGGFVYAVQGILGEAGHARWTVREIRNVLSGLVQPSDVPSFAVLLNKAANEREVETQTSIGDPIVYGESSGNFPITPESRHLSAVA
jgi:hypothetical protein